MSRAFFLTHLVRDFFLIFSLIVELLIDVWAQSFSVKITWELEVAPVCNWLAWLIDWLIAWLIDSLIAWLIDWVILSTFWMDFATFLPVMHIFEYFICFTVWWKIDCFPKQKLWWMEKGCVVKFANKWQNLERRVFFLSAWIIMKGMFRFLEILPPLLRAILLWRNFLTRKVAGSSYSYFGFCLPWMLLRLIAWLARFNKVQSNNQAK